MSKTRRNFMKKAVTGLAGMAISQQAFATSPKNYRNIVGANERINVAIAGLGRRLKAYVEPVSTKKANVKLAYLCDVMQSQRENALNKFSEHINYKPALENDIRKVLADKEVDAVINATPDHWHAPMAFMALQAGKDMYLEKPVSHNPRESELLLDYQQKYGHLIQMGAQQRSSPESIEIINEIHNGMIGETYKAVSFYANGRGRVVNPEPAQVPPGLDWELFQGPAPRKAYEHDTWDYNWHWYGWDYGTAETGNNATHELDVARWALDVKYPKQVFVEAAKRHFKDDGWSMYDTMEATFIFPGNKVIQWDGQSRNKYHTYGYDRGTIIYGTDGSVFINRDGYKLYDRQGQLVREKASGSDEAGTALGGGGGMSTLHVLNFFNAMRGKEKLNLPISEGVISQHLTHLPNIAYRVGKPLEIDVNSGKIYDRDAMKLWGREYEPGWEPDLIS
ncbi:MAG: Gfo/Idh/MocA family protein [Candidatus Cyclobacteriaceae bacterium M3_2C_046]